MHVHSPCMAPYMTQTSSSPLLKSHRSFAETLSRRLPPLAPAGRSAVEEPEVVAELLGLSGSGSDCPGIRESVGSTSIGASVDIEVRRLRQQVN